MRRSNLDTLSKVFEHRICFAEYEIVSTFKTNLKQFKFKVQREGLKTAAVGSLKSVRQNPQVLFGGAKDGYQQSSRVDTNQRWELISKNIPNEDISVLDIGCNEGELTKKAGDIARFVVGVDVDPNALEAARNKNCKNCYFTEFPVEPNNVDKLPRCDVTFLFTVYYHWGRTFSWSEAEQMLRIVADNTDSLFFQTPETHHKIESERTEQYSDLLPRQMIENYLYDVLENKEVEYIGTTDYMGGNRKDAMYIIQ